MGQAKKHPDGLSSSSHRGQGNGYTCSAEFPSLRCFRTLNRRTECHYYVEMFGRIDRTFLSMSQNNVASNSHLTQLNSVQSFQLSQGYWHMKGNVPESQS